MAAEASGSASGPEQSGGARRSAFVAMALAWLVPGAGHVYLGRPRRGALYFVVLATMLVAGLWLEGTLSQPRPGELLSLLATLADMGLGPVYFVLRAAGDEAIRHALVSPEVLAIPGHTAASAATHEFGNAYHWSAGIMNMLLVLDAYDIAVGRK